MFSRIKARLNSMSTLKSLCLRAEYGKPPGVGDATDPLIAFLCPYYKEGYLVAGHIQWPTDVKELAAKTGPAFRKIRSWIEQEWTRLPGGGFFIGPEANELNGRGRPKGQRFPWRLGETHDDGCNGKIPGAEVDRRMSCQYFEKWVGSRKSGIKPLSEAEAAARHERKQPYVALALADEGNQCVVQLHSSGAYVLFLDEMRRGHLSYQFDDHPSGKLFLSVSTFREYADASDDPVKVTTFKFQPDGAMEIYVSDRHAAEEHEKTGTADAAPNWEEYPAFGQYSRLCRVNRVTA